MITIKTDEEIEVLRQGGRIHSAILRQIAEKVASGVSTKGLDDYARKLIKEAHVKPAFLGYRPEGARKPYPAALCVSINDEIVHGIPNDSPAVLKEGDIVSLDLGLIYQGLITDAALTVGVGKISHEDQTLIRATKEALTAGISSAKEGSTIGDIGHAIQSVAKKYNFNIVEGLSGHGVGYKVHEEPYVPNTGIPSRGPILKDGMVLAIEPMFVKGKSAIVLDKDGYTYRTRDGKKAAHFEHTVVIDGAESIILTA